MPTLETLREPWPAFLSELDALLAAPVDIRCLGAFVLTAIYGAPRFTSDLDYLDVRPSAADRMVEELAGRSSKLAKKHGVWVQRVGTGLVDLPENYEVRLQYLDLGLKNLRLFVLEPYDLCLSKLTRNNPKDREDIKFFARHENLSYGALYQRFASEMKPWVARSDWHEGTLEKVWKEYFPRP